MAKQTAATQKSAYHCCDESPALVELCSECPYPDCIGDARKGCAEYQKASEAIRNGAQYAPPPSWGAKTDEPPAEVSLSVPPSPEEPVDPQALFDAAWEKLAASRPPSIMIEPDEPPAESPPIVPPSPAPPDAERADLRRMNAAIRALSSLSKTSFISISVPDIIAQLKAARTEAFEHLVDWDAVAKGQANED